MKLNLWEESENKQSIISKLKLWQGLVSSKKRKSVILKNKVTLE